MSCAYSKSKAPWYNCNLHRYNIYFIYTVNQSTDVQSETNRNLKVLFCNGCWSKILLQCSVPSVHQFYVNILVSVNINPFSYINVQFALKYLCDEFLGIALFMACQENVRKNQNLQKAAKVKKYSNVVFIPFW